MIPIRIGNGYDLHQLVAGRPLILGGVQIEHELGLLGHSDADALTHAIMDAMLGALSLGDIGHYFPPSEPQWAGADSLKLLAQVNQLIQDRGWQVSNLDSVIVAERPKLKPHLGAMARSPGPGPRPATRSNWHQGHHQRKVRPRGARRSHCHLCSRLVDPVLTAASVPLSHLHPIPYPPTPDKESP